MQDTADVHPDLDGVPCVSLEEARLQLSTRFTKLQSQFASLSLLSREDQRRATHYENVKNELDAVGEDLGRLDYFINLNSHHDADGASVASRDPPSPRNHDPENKVPQHLPQFRGTGADADDFLETLVNRLVAHDMDKSRWTAALLACCTVNADAAWVRENIFSRSWEEAEAIFQDL